MFERVGAKKTEKGVAVFMRAYGSKTTLSIGEGEQVGIHGPRSGATHFQCCRRRYHPDPLHVHTHGTTFPERLQDVH
jgi:hypothetical protein